MIRIIHAGNFLRRLQMNAIYDSFFATELGQGIEAYLREPRTLDLIRVASRLGHPALNVLDEEVEARFGDEAFEDYAKHSTGYMVRQIVDAAGGSYKDDAECVQPCRYGRAAVYSF
jgi:hypothetical protein